jgi:hypothetical protein
MSDDLISREAVIAAVDRHTREDGTLDDDISVILEEVETTFDKEKVIEEIEESAKLYSLSDRDCEFAVPINVSLEIVEKGGVE